MYFLITSAVTLSPPSEQIPIFPKLSAPQLLPDLRKLLPNLLGADRLQQPHHRADRVLRRKTEKQMDMILVHLQFLNLKSVMPCNLPKQFPDPLPNRPLQHPFPILGRPHQMIAGVVHTVAGSSDGYATTLADRCCLRQHAFFLPALPGGAFKCAFSE